jgi:hypothetical protein
MGDEPAEPDIAEDPPSFGWRKVVVTCFIVTLSFILGLLSKLTEQFAFIACTALAGFHAANAVENRFKKS